MMGSLEPVFKKMMGFKRIYIDLPGMGKSNAVPGIRSSYDIFKITKSLIEDLTREQPFYMIGQSYGGYLTQCLAKTLKKVEGIFLIAPVVVPEPEKRDVNTHRVFINEFKPKHFASSDEKETFKIMVVRTKQIWEETKKYILPGWMAANRGLLDKIYKGSYRIPIDILKFKKKFIGHACFVLGRQDSVVGYRDALRVLDNYPRASVNIINPAGHHLQYEQPELFRLSLKEWLVNAMSSALAKQHFASHR
jgi:pimeloyl-ACP methyl ester carboxylesterase